MGTTKAELAQKIAREVPRFIEKNRHIPFQDKKWKVGPGGITLDKLILVDVHWATWGTIQASLRVIV